MQSDHPPPCVGQNLLPPPAFSNYGRQAPSTLFLLMGIAAFLSFGMLLVTTRDRLRSAEIAFSRGEYPEAFELAEDELKIAPGSSQALLIAGLSANELNHTDLAMRFLARFSDERNENTTRALIVVANYALQQARAADAERLYRHILEIDPDHVESLQQLGYLLSLEGRGWEAQQMFLRVLQSGEINFHHLIAIGSTKSELDNSKDFGSSGLAAVPDDLSLLLPEARKAYTLHDADGARKLLERIIRSRPQILEAQALLGTLLVESDDLNAFLAWHTQLPETADEHPGIWFARGLWAVQTGQREGAVRCFAEVLVRQPNHVGANHQLSQLLAALGDEASAIEFGDRTRDLVRLELAIASVSTQWQTDQVLRIVRLLESLGRNWEAASWCHLALTNAPAETWPRQTLQRLQPSLGACRSLIIDSANLVSRLNLTRHSLPTWRIHALPHQPQNQESSPGTQVAFAEVANAAGLRFAFRNGSYGGDVESLLEFNGGGVAVLDYDGDHWPDLYLTQGGPRPYDDVPRLDVDRLFRNLGNGRFHDVTESACLHEAGYSQGVTVGDVNSDGFPDLYVGNIGPNSLFLNNGDGTFQDATQVSGTAGSEWTSSCVLADINGDTFPDIYSVRYIGGENLKTRPCLKSAPVRCALEDYPSVPDRLYLNMGDGRFEEITQSAGIVDVDGKGLGIVAADFDDSHRLSLFVGNDMQRNFLFANQTSLRGGAPTFAERAVLMGIAVDTRGAPKASMGIAVGDANGDGLFDLFITNFYKQSSNLYVQHSDHTFSDGTQSANLAEAGVYMVGWGTQFLDGELDGSPDLIATNGHIHIPTDTTIPYRMPAQYFRNTGNGRFIELPAAAVGSFFAEKHLGRGLARLDWNRDGLEEACISHLDSSAALLLNKTRNHGHYIAVILVGVDGSRDAIGTTVRIVADGRDWKRQLTAGDGYQASNERKLVFGVGALERVDRIEVDWSSGRSQLFSNPAIDREYVIVEGRSNPVVLGQSGDE